MLYFRDCRAEFAANLDSNDRHCKFLILLIVVAIPGFVIAIFRKPRKLRNLSLFQSFGGFEALVEFSSS